MPATTHVCPSCTPQHPCYFTEGEIVALKDDPVNDPLSLWTGIVLEVERNSEGRVYRVMWGAPAMNAAGGGAPSARHTGEHRVEELERFLVPAVASAVRGRSGGGGDREGRTHAFEPLVP